MSVPLRGVAAISAGLGFSLALRGGEVFAWGAGEGGQLGDGARADRRVPRPVIAEVSALCAGDFHALALFAGKPQTPAAELIPARRALTLLWRSSDSSDSWHVSWRLAKAGAPWEGTAVLAPAARSYQITGLRAGRTYEVKLASAGFPALILSGTPLPARQAKPRRRVSPRAAARSRPAAARR